MPEIVIYLAEGREPDKKRALMKDITDAVMKNFGVIRPRRSSSRSSNRRRPTR